MGVVVMPPKPEMSEDHLPLLTAEDFADAAAIPGDLFPSRDFNQAFLPETPQSVVPQKQRFEEFRKRWSSEPVIELVDIVQLLADIDRKPSTLLTTPQDSKGWQNLVGIATPPKIYIDELEDYYDRAPMVSRI